MAAIKDEQLTPLCRSAVRISYEFLSTEAFDPVQQHPYGPSFFSAHSRQHSRNARHIMQQPTRHRTHPQHIALSLSQRFTSQHSSRCCILPPLLSLFLLVLSRFFVDFTLHFCSSHFRWFAGVACSSRLVKFQGVSLSRMDLLRPPVL